MAPAPARDEPDLSGSAGDPRASRAIGRRERTARLARRRRRLGVGLVAFGALGLGLITAGLLLVGGLSPSAERPDARTELLATVDAARQTLRDAEIAARDTDRGLASGSTAAGSAGTFMADMSSTLRTLAASLRIELPFVGGAPLGAAAGQFDALADRAAGLAADLDAVRGSLEVSGRDLVRLADGLGDLEAQLGAARTSVEQATGVDGLGAVRLLGMALLGWLAIPAAASVLLGIHLLRPRAGGRRSRTEHDDVRKAPLAEG